MHINYDNINKLSRRNDELSKFKDALQSKTSMESMRIKLIPRFSDGPEPSLTISGDEYTIRSSELKGFFLGYIDTEVSKNNQAIKRALGVTTNETAGEAE